MAAWWLALGIAWAAPWPVRVHADGRATVEVPAELPAMDLRLERLDPYRAAVAKPVDGLLGCEEPWRADALWRAVSPGAVALSLPSTLPPGAWAFLGRRAGTNEDWEVVSEGHWMFRAPVDVAVPCAGAAPMRLDVSPALAAGREAARRSTVRVEIGALVGLGLVVGPWGEVLAPSSLAAGGAATARYAPGVLAVPEVTIRMQRVDAPGLPEGVMLLVPSDAADLPGPVPYTARLVGAPAQAPLRVDHRGVWFGVGLDDGALVPVRPSLQPGQVVSTDAPPAWRGALDPGSPLIDHAGRVWGLVVDGQRAVWSVDLLTTLGNRPVAPPPAAPLSPVQPPDRRLAAVLDASDEVVRLAAVTRALGGATRQDLDRLLTQLDELLGVQGWRASLVDDALEVLALHDALALALPRGRRQRDAVARLAAVARARFDWDAAAGAAAAVVTDGDAAARVWAPAPPKGWFRVDLRAERALEVWQRGCDFVELRLFDERGQRVGGPRYVDDFAPQQLPAYGDLHRAWLRVTPQAGCEGQPELSFLAREAPVALPRGSAEQAPIALTGEGAWRVLPEPGADTWLSLPLDGGAVYEIRTRDLRGDTDTRLRVELPRGRVEEDDDGGGGRSSRVRFENLLPGEARVRVALAREDVDSSFAVEVQRVFRYGVTDPVALADAPVDLPGAAWSGHAMPVTLTGDAGALRLQTVRGNVYVVQTALDVDLVGPTGQRALRLLRQEEEPAWAVRGFSTFLALEGGVSTLKLRRPSDGHAEDPWFVQVVDRPAQPEPRLTDLGPDARRAYDVVASTADRFDGGLLTELAPGDEGWIRFQAQPGVGYTVQADGDHPGASVALHAWLGDPAGRADLADTRGTPLASVATTVSARQTALVRVRNTGAEPARVRVSVLADVPYDSFQVGDEVKLGRHTPFGGSTNWTEGMDIYVLRNATITHHLGQDEWGAWVVRVDLDGGQFVWRTRDLTLTRRAAVPPRR